MACLILKGCPLTSPALLMQTMLAMLSHAGHTLGLLFFLNNAPIFFYSKCQNTVESSTVDSEFVALRIACDMVVALRYKVLCFGVPLTGSSSILCDNQCIVKNTNLPASILNKKHYSINYHLVHEAATTGILRVGKEESLTNLADPLKTLSLERDDMN